MMKSFSIMDMRIKNHLLILACKLQNGTTAFPSEHKKNRYAFVPLPYEQYTIPFKKLEQKWNGTIAFPCERGLTYKLSSYRTKELTK